MSNPPTIPEKFSHRKAIKAGVASFAGTSIEFYDFYVYATAAALVFPKLFFPESSPIMALLASFGTYAVGFFARPLGGIIFGHVGDRLGRRRSLVLTLILMGVSTTLVGVLPTHAAVGILAPFLLVILRVCQGLAVGGEWGGAVLMSVENAPEKFKGFYGAFPQLGNPMGALLSSGAFALLTISGDDFLLDWGWRIPFLASAVLIVIGYWIRARIEETPVFEAEVKTRDSSTTDNQLPFAIALRKNWAAMIIAVGLLPITGGGFYLVTTFATSYATGDISDIGLNANLFLTVLTVASFVELVSTMLVGWLADHVGRKRLMAVSLVVFLGLSIPMFLVLDGGPVWLIFALFSINRIALNGTWAPLAAIMSQMFGPASRQTSISFSYSVGSAIWSGLAPTLATALYGLNNSIWAVISMLAIMTTISLICLGLAPQVRDRVFEQEALTSE